MLGTSSRLLPVPASAQACSSGLQGLWGASQPCRSSVTQCPSFPPAAFGSRTELLQSVRQPELRLGLGCGMYML
eukprot:scaffold2004_cov420-Prasinococcus_capsulatus_cf.AAC.15